MRKILFPLFSLLLITACQPKQEPLALLPPTAFENSQGMETETYESGISYWKMLDERYESLKLLEYGTTDAGLPLHLAVLSPNKVFNPNQLQQENKTIILINNAIHPGEADGVDASIWLCKDLLERGNLQESMGDVVLAVIPFYNVGGALNRNSSTRANQEGPKSYGFRGNARNYDLNRDFIKADTKNAWTFHQLFQEWNPDILVDTHVSNGADYQHVLTYLATQSQKLGPVLGGFMEEELSPALFAQMKEAGFPMTPYVNVWGTTPDKGWAQFIDHPRYSTGYAALHHTLGVMTETHMLKPFKQRVEATHAFLESMLAFAKDNSSKIKSVRKQAIAEAMQQEQFPIQWKNNKEKWVDFQFKGYEGSYIPSEVTGLQRLKYDRNKPYEKLIKWYNFYEPALEVSKPKAYIIPQAWGEVIERLAVNGVEMRQFAQDTSLTVHAYTIEGFQTVDYPYEGHYPHNQVEISKKAQSLHFCKGDYWLSTNQEKVRFLVETLEPQAVDSYFAWNFFDAILQRKEGFSPYVFEDKAKELLASNDSLRQVFEAKQQSDKDFAANAYAQLMFIYNHSDHAEATYRRYPVFRVEIGN